jgi:glycosyltransferase involved in cell wall biosynthesis
MHIGYLVQQFPPEVGAGPARVLEMARCWIRAGDHVTVFTGMPNRPEGRIHAAYRRRLVADETLEGIRVLRSWLYASPKHGFARTLLNNATFMATSAVHALLRSSDVDVLIASSPPFFPHISGAVVRWIRRMPLVLEVRDLWPDYLVDMNVLAADSFATRALFGTERRLLRSADAVTVVTDSFRRRVEAKGVEPSRVHVMPAGVDPEAYYLSDEPPPLPALARSNGEVVVGYLGNFGAGQALETVLGAALQIQQKSDRIRFVLVGDGPQRALLEQRRQELGLTNLSIHPPIPKTLTRAFYASCDFCLVPLAPVPVFQETVPSKIFEILACERPIVASVDGEARAIMEASGGGWVTPPGDAGELAAALVRAAEVPPETRRAMGAHGRAYVTRQYSRQAIADSYLTLLRQVVAARSSAAASATRKKVRA